MGKTRTAALLAILAVATATLAGAQSPAALRVKVFPGFNNLPIYAAQARGLFARHGLDITLQFTRTSDELRGGLARGEFEIAHAAVDNAVAMVETAGADIIIVMGGDSGLNELVVQPGIASAADLRGKTLLVDAPNTAYALLLKKMLRVQGLRDGQDYTITAVGGTAQRFAALRENKEYAGSMLNPPFSILAAEAGLRSLGTAVSVTGPYQATGAFVRREWARANAAALERYIAAYVEGLRWALEPGNRAEAGALLAERLRLAPGVGRRVLDLAAAPGGFARDAALDLEGFRNVLALRAEIEGQWGGQVPAPERYYDLAYYRRALGLIGR